jgi:hypothetical protein
MTLDRAMIEAHPWSIQCMRRAVEHMLEAWDELSSLEHELGVDFVDIEDIVHDTLCPMTNNADSLSDEILIEALLSATTY